MSHQHAPAIFIADSVGLDFLNSVATPVDEEVDWLATGEGLLDWCGQANLVPAEALDELRANAVPGELDNVAAQARSLREWFRTFVYERKGSALTRQALKELEPLNRLLERGNAFKQIVGSDDGRHGILQLQTYRRWRSPESLLVPIAEALAQLVSEEDFTDVKSCEGARCTLLFADHTRGRARRWCSMAVCGNRAKAAAHRNRVREQSQKE